MTVTIEGLDDVSNILDRIAPRAAKNLIRATVHAYAGRVAKKIKQKAPVRKGILKKAIKTKRRRGRQGMVQSDVIITHGANARNDAFYWRFIEYGTLDQSEKPFIRPAIQEVNLNRNNILIQEFGKKLERQITSRARRLGI